MAAIKIFGFKIGKDQGGFPTYLRTNFAYGVKRLLSANTEYVLLVPAGVNLAIFQKSIGINIWIAQDENPNPNSIIIPDNTAWVDANDEYNVPGITIISGQYLHFLTDADCFINVKLLNDGTSQR